MEGVLQILNLIILLITLCVLIWYTIETHRIANQGMETNIRPIILRTGWISDWNKIKSIDEIDNLSGSNLLEFENLKNIAEEISGNIIIENKKYELLFGNNITKEELKRNNKLITKIGLSPKWGWLPVGGRIYASFNSKEFIETKEKNQIYLEYKDIEGNFYYTKEDLNFYQKSKKVKKLCLKKSYF